MRGLLQLQQAETYRRAAQTYRQQSGGRPKLSDDYARAASTYRQASASRERREQERAAATHRQKDMFFFLVQSELGDVYKISLEHSPEHGVTDVRNEVMRQITPEATAQRSLCDALFETILASGKSLVTSAELHLHCSVPHE